MPPKHLSDGLADLARSNEQKRDSALLRATTELFVLDVVHDRDEIRRFEELTIHFLPKASAVDRAFVSERLAVCADAPLSVIQLLARDAIEVAAPVLKHSSVLGPVDLLAVIAATGAEHHRLIARRTILSPEVKRALSLTGDAAVLARLGGVVPQAGNDTAAPVIDPTASQTGGIYRSNRLDPWRFMSLDRPARFKLIADIASRPPPMPYAANSTRLDRAFRSILGAAQIVGYARSGQVGPIVAAIADGLGIQPSLVAGAINDKGGEAFAVMLKALRLDDTQARQVFLLVSPSGRDVQNFFPLSDLYAGMEPSVAETMVEAWRNASAPGAATYEPHLAENGDRRRPASAESPPLAASTPEEKAKRA